MSFFNAFDRIAITGLSNATWLRDKSLDGLLTVPVGATYAVIEFYGSGTYGFQDSDDTTDFIYTSVTSSSIFKFVPINASKAIDLYVSNTTTGSWRLVGYTSHITKLASPASIGSFSGAGTKTIDCSAIVPTDAINGSALIEFNLNMKVGASLNLTSQNFPNLTQKGHVVVPLDANRYFYVNSSGAAINAGDIKILGWMAPEAYQHETTFPQIAPAATSTWEKLTGSWGTVFDSWRMYSNSDTHQRSIRRNGSSYTEFQNLQNRFTWVNPSTAGEIDGYKNNAAVTFSRFGGFFADSASASILTIDTFVAGATATVVFDKSVTSITKLRVTSNVLSLDGVNPIDTHYIDITSFSGSGTTWTFAVPSPTDATDGIRFGAVTITPTTNSGTGADFTGKVYSKTDYDSVNIETPVSGNVCEGDTPALAMDDQLAYQYGSISVGGVYSDPTESFIGTQTIWHYSVSDYKWYSFTLTTEGGGTPPVTGGGLTSSGLTSSGLTRAGLTSAGL